MSAFVKHFGQNDAKTGTKLLRGSRLPSLRPVLPRQNAVSRRLKSAGICGSGVQQAGHAGQFLAFHGVAASYTSRVSACGENWLVSLRLLFKRQTLRWFGA